MQNQCLACIMPQLFCKYAAQAAADSLRMPLKQLAACQHHNAAADRDIAGGIDLH